MNAFGWICVCNRSTLGDYGYQVSERGEIGTGDVALEITRLCGGAMWKKKKQKKQKNRR